MIFWSPRKLFKVFSSVCHQGAQSKVDTVAMGIVKFATVSNCVMVHSETKASKRRKRKIATRKQVLTRFTLFHNFHEKHS